MKKIITPEQAQAIIKQLKAKGKTIVLTGGCFDILHLGHLKFFEAAKKQGDILIVALESDENVKRLKGEGRPINNQEKRAKKLAEIPSVDFIIKIPELVNDVDYQSLVKLVSPDIIAVTAGDSILRNKQKQAKMVGGKVKIVIDHLEGFSTTQIVKNL